ncbi:trace amine-associated receptor 13c-like [Labrus mixtus]|uniref:trace amine-associated receptor 13c-like n=1 Tax=Labrus mixtus TaxID=508554 RepID=UPI0029C042C8|nr:trace amine-associated receptor 13c-like [Labrus mixtus]
MKVKVGAELCFPHLFNASCKKPTTILVENVYLLLLFPSASLLTVALNLLIIISVFHFRHLHTPTNILLLSLAVSDCLVGLILIPNYILLQTSCWFFSDHVCTLLNYFTFIITSTSIGNIVLISVDRYVAICDPLHYSTRVTQRRVTVCVCLCWLCSFCYNTLSVKEEIGQPGRYRSCYGECVFAWDLQMVYVDLVVTFIAPISAIIFLYMRVFVVAVSQARAMRSHVTAVSLQLSLAHPVNKSELKAARTLGVLVVVFLICFCPYYSLSPAGDSVLSDASISFVVFLFYLNSCLNPLIYALFYPWFRKAVKLIVTLQILQPCSREAKIL